MVRVASRVRLVWVWCDVLKEVVVDISTRGVEVVMWSLDLHSLFGEARR